MDESRNYRQRRCQHCGGTGYIEVGGPMDFKSTDKMSQAELQFIAKNAVRSPVPAPHLPPPPPLPTRGRVPSGRFPSVEPPTMPDENWVNRHITRIRTKQWRLVQLSLFVLLVLLVLLLHRLR